LVVDDKEAARKALKTAGVRRIFAPDEMAAMSALGLAALWFLGFVSQLAELCRPLYEPVFAPSQFLIRQRSVAQEIKNAISHLARLGCTFVVLSASWLLRRRRERPMN
jgi:hypothetical protein